MKTALLVLAYRMAAAFGFFHPDPSVIKSAVEAVAVDKVPLFGGQEEELAVMLTWMVHESSYDAGAVGDGGRSHGVLQQRLVMPLDEQPRAWLRLLHADALHCGSAEGALRAVSSGSCDRARVIVSSRLEEAWLVLELAR